MVDHSRGRALPAVLVVSIVPQGKGEQVVKAARAGYAAGEFIMYGLGTASDKIWERLGVTKNRDREIVLCFTMYNKMNDVMQSIASVFDSKKKYNGIVFAISVEKSLSKGLVQHIMKKSMIADDLIADLGFGEEMENFKKKVGDIMSQYNDDKKAAQEECDSQLIIIRMANGYGQEIMDCARKAGAMGGTIMHGRMPSDSTEGKFFNITIDPEGDILFMIASKTITDKILDAIASQYGPPSPAHALGVVVPVLKTLKISSGQE